MYLVKIALRNLFRRRSRTIIIAGVLALAILFALMIDTFMGGMMEMSFNNIIDFEAAHIEIGQEEFFADDFFDLEQVFSPTEEMKSKVRDLPGFVAKTAVIDFPANILAGREEFPARIRAIDPVSFAKVFRNEKYLIEGEFISSGDSAVVIGSDLAAMMDLEVGDYYTLLFRDKHGSFNTMQGEIKGITTTPHPDMNLNTVIVDREYAVTTLGIAETEITQIMVRMADRTIAVEQAEKLQSMINNPQYIVRSWRDASETLLAMEAWGQIETLFIMGLILLIGAIGIINVVVLSALERIEEIGMMKALGLKQIDILKVFSLEAVGVGIVGGLIGCGLGALGTSYLNIFGFDIQLIYGDATLEMGIPIIGKIYGVWNPASFLLFFVFAMLIALVASIIPAYWAARKNPVEAIHHR